MASPVQPVAQTLLRSATKDHVADHLSVGIEKASDGKIPVIFIGKYHDDVDV